MAFCAFVDRCAHLWILKHLECAKMVQRNVAVIWLAWVDGGWSPRICEFVSILTLEMFQKPQMHAAIHKCTGRDLQMNVRPSCVCRIKRYLSMFFYLFTNLILYICELFKFLFVDNFVKLLDLFVDLILFCLSVCLTFVNLFTFICGS